MDLDAWNTHGATCIWLSGNLKWWAAQGRWLRGGNLDAQTDTTPFVICLLPVALIAPADANMELEGAIVISIEDESFNCRNDRTFDAAMPKPPLAMHWPDSRWREWTTAMAALVRTYQNDGKAAWALVLIPIGILVMLFGGDSSAGSINTPFCFAAAILFFGLSASMKTHNRRVDERIHQLNRRMSDRQLSLRLVTLYTESCKRYSHARTYRGVYIYQPQHEQVLMHMASMPVQGVPVQGLPMPGVPQMVQGEPVEGVPVEGVPVQSASGQHLPRQRASGQRVPGHAAVQRAPLQSAPVQGMPAMEDVPSVQRVPVDPTGPIEPIEPVPGVVVAQPIEPISPISRVVQGFACPEGDATPGSAAATPPVAVQAPVVYVTAAPMPDGVPEDRPAAATTMV